MLAVYLFIAFWVVLALIVFFLAGTGGPQGARRAVTRPRRGSRGMAVVMGFLYIAFGIAIPVAFLSGNHANANSHVGGIRLTADEKAGRQTFGMRCGFCHTLAAANANGKVGPNLDDIKPPYSLVLNTINNGCLANPPSPSSPQACLNQGNMPAGIIQGKQAQQVASFVAAVAGKE